MGEIAEMMLDGTLCQSCGEFMGEEVGYPRFCASCAQELGELHGEVKVKVPCPTCGKKVKAAGLADHQRDVHGAPPAQVRSDE